MPIGIPRHNIFSPRNPGGENTKTGLWVATVVAAGGTVSTARRSLVNNVFNSLDAFGLTSRIGRLWLLAAENTQAASVDLISLASYTLVNSPTFATDRGYTTNGTSSYLNLGTTVCGTLNASMYGCFMRTAVGSIAQASIGQVGASINPHWSDGLTYWSCNDAEGFGGTTGVPTTVGGWIVTRTSSGGADCYKDGSTLGSNGQVSTAINTTQNFFLGAYNSSTGPSFFCAAQFSAAYLGASGGAALNATQAANLNTIIQTYMTAVGA